MGTCDHCCGADKLFDLKNAKKELKSFRKNGAGRVTRKLIALLRPGMEKTSSLLDVGGGIGAIQWSFLENSKGSTTDVDASAGYLQVAKSYATDKGWENRAVFKMGDFIDLEHEIESHEIVSMDKVVCCYPDYKAILDLATEKCSRTLVLSFPMSGVIANVFRGIGVLYMKIKKNPFRPYIHSPAKMEELIASKGFRRVKHTIVFPWHIRMYERT